MCVRSHLSADTVQTSVSEPQGQAAEVPQMAKRGRECEHVCVFVVLCYYEDQITSHEISDRISKGLESHDGGQCLVYFRKKKKTPDSCPFQFSFAFS